ncbi:MAG: hypothetical protein ABSE64_03730 [Vulcanimicrobiaceae bacterium]|jgi:hypothetical protein
MPRRISAALFALGLLTVGCQEKPTPASLYSSASDIKILDNRFVSSNDASVGTVGGASQSYLIFKLELDNDISSQLFPVATHFVFTASDGSRYAGIDSGSSALIGISNDYSPMKRGDVRKFGVAFKMAFEQAGTISYEY